ncbi:hypothetical protein H6P81_009579 [Aristolochia fimbriata]|uniref:Uncharacterized protein n=1 Tax=Aristolochia fimbriata TaxID=158543 RepID=A0AAV7ELV5_ARIFI|nr:hypothetical protein H6P81_009579 [Aristolochia fimbriata]
MARKHGEFQDVQPLFKIRVTCIRRRNFRQITPYDFFFSKYGAYLSEGEISVPVKSSDDESMEEDTILGYEVALEGVVSAHHVENLVLNGIETLPKIDKPKSIINPSNNVNRELATGKSW